METLNENYAERITIMKQGTQIAYIPNHANGNINHPDVEFGFVTTVRGSNQCFCRYWRKGKPGTLRTTLNSELTLTKNLREAVSVDQAIVNSLIAMYSNKAMTSSL